MTKRQIDKVLLTQGVVIFALALWSMVLAQRCVDMHTTEALTFVCYLLCGTLSFDGSQRIYWAFFPPKKE